MHKQVKPELLELDFTREAELACGRWALNKMLLQCYLQDLRSDKPRVRKKGAKGLGSLGAVSRPALAKLESLLEDPDPKVRAAVEAALAAIRG
jgi:HEAT repeat protein